MQTLQQILDAAWEYKMQHNPLLATFYGDHRFNDRLPIMTTEEIDKNIAKQQFFLEKLKELDYSQLSNSEQRNFDIFKQLIDEERKEYEFNAHLMPIGLISGFHIYLAELPNQTPFSTFQDYQNYISRLNGFKDFLEQHIELMRLGMSKQVVIAKITISPCANAIEAQAVTDIHKNLFYKPFLQLPQNFSTSQKEELCQQAEKAIKENVVPFYQKFASFLKEEYLPKAREEIAISSLPNGKKYYEFLVKQYTTLDITPEEIHKKGLEEVERINKQMQEIIKKVEFNGNFAEFVQFLRTEPKFYSTSEHQLLAEVSLILKKMDGELPNLFKKLPRTPYGVKPVPESIAPRMPTAYYMPSSGDGSRAGYYFVNTYDLKSRPLYELEALSLHEAVPGHHLQLALQKELENMPIFRRFAHITAYLEGWALYSEKLGKEVGFYQDPYSDFGRLTYEIWRAVRLVVDTGIHYLGWDREKAVKFMTENSALAEHNIGTEVDRYISLPGQAISYKTGELKISALRKRTEEKLGDNFDIREFHDVLLREGAIPLSMLEQDVNDYINQKQKST